MANGFRTEFQSISDLLAGLGFEMSALTQPGTLYGFGQGQRFEGFDEFFSPFDIQGFESAQNSLRELETNLLSNVSQQFSQQSQDLRQRFSGTMDDIRNQSGRTGLVSGAQDRQRRMAQRVGMQEQSGLVASRESGMQSVQENIGRQLGQLEGTLLDFLGNQAQTALQIRSLDIDESSPNTGAMMQPGVIGSGSGQQLLSNLQNNIISSFGNFGGGVY